MPISDMIFTVETPESRATLRAIDGPPSGRTRFPPNHRQNTRGRESWKSENLIPTDTPRYQW
jgi:hypothetical protein